MKNLQHTILLQFLLRGSVVAVNQIHPSVKLSLRLQTGKMKIDTMLIL